MTFLASGLDYVSPFVNGHDNIACYRVPSMVVMGSGELLAVVEGRVENCGDHGGPIRMLGKISQDQGKTWEGTFEIARNILPDGTEQVAQNPCLVVDRMDPDHPEGKIILMFNKAEQGEHGVAEGGGVRRVYVIESIDHGRTWVNERDITTEVHRPNRPAYTAIYDDAATRYAHPDDWRAQFPPVGHAIQLRGGLAERSETRGRLFFAAYTTIGDRGVLRGQAYAIWSDDHGKTWRHSDASPVEGVNEMMAAELADGSVLVNFRNYTNDEHEADPVRGQMVYRFNSSGAIDLATTHTEPQDLIMPWPGLQGTLIRYQWPDENAPDSRSILLFSSADHFDQRVGMTVWLSEDEGTTWPIKRLVDSGPSAYSDMAVLPDSRVALIYERGGTDGMNLVVFSLAWVEGP